MSRSCVACLLVFLFCFSGVVHGQQPVNRQRPAILYGGDLTSPQKLMEQSARSSQAAERALRGGTVSVQFGRAAQAGTAEKSTAAMTTRPTGTTAARPTTGIPARAPRPLNGPGCVDAMGHILTTEVSGCYFGPVWISRTSDGGVLAPGYRQDLGGGTPFTYPYLMRYAGDGSVVWSKSFDGMGIYPINSALAYKCWELNDGTLLLVGSVDIPEIFNGRSEFCMWHLDANGNLLWAQSDSCSFWTQYSGSLAALYLLQDQQGYIYIGGNQYAFDALTTGTFVMKMDEAGHILWDQNFTSRGSDLYGMMWTGKELALVGNNSDASNIRYIWCLKVDAATGDTLRSKAWMADYDPTGIFYNSYTPKGWATLLDNGHICVTGPPMSDFASTAPPVVHDVVTEFDADFNYVSGYMLKSNLLSNWWNSLITPYPSGRIAFTYSTYIGSYDQDVVYGAIESGQISKERVYHERNRSNAWSTNFINMSGNEDVILQTFGTPTPGVAGAEFIRLHDSDTSSDCSGHDSVITWIESYRMKPYPWVSWDGVIHNGFLQTNRILPPTVAGNPTQQNVCLSASACANLRLVSDQIQVCAGSPVTFTAMRNEGCGGRPIWTFDTTNIASFQVLNDTAMQLTYRDQFNGAITAAMVGTCASLADSKQLTVLPANKPISLGGDHYLCPDSTLVLRPAKGYSSYTWSDGSVADTLVVTQPGNYTVQVTNVCGNPSSDQAQVLQAPNLSFSAGPDIRPCIGDPVTLDAPDGYSNYVWTDLTSGKTFAGQSIHFDATASTPYQASAKTALGCFVKSGLQVTVNFPLPLFLGNDTSFCIGNGIVLNAGNGFLQYQWSTGATSETIMASKPGSYWVKATAPNGCYSKDTLVVVSNYPLPVVSLPADSWLCEGTTRILDAGKGFTDYAWQDGSHATSIVADTTGVYWVHVTDSKGCSGGDTVTIRRMAANPSDFVVADTLICNNYPSKIPAKAGYRNYAWSTGETGNTITVSHATNLSLTVTDNFGCTATEDIAITTKQCLFGIYFPTAFSPNADGRNDLYKPYAFGNISHYHLQVFNRWGQMVFSTEDYTRGWDGMINGTPQPAGTYVWICRYQFEGEAATVERGTVMMIR